MQTTKITSSDFGRIAFATNQAYPKLTPDDRLLLDPLAELGITVTPAIWNDPTVEWTSFDLVVIRSPWDYYYHFKDFIGWLRMLEREGVRTLNTIPTLLWNSRKTYLRQLEHDGVAIAPTHWMEIGSKEKLSDILRSHQWSECVVKPAVSAGGFQMAKLSLEQADSYQLEVEKFLTSSEVLVQPFLPEVLKGEWSFLFYGEEFSHCVHKTPKAGEYRIQVEHGGTYVKASPPKAWIDEATRVLKLSKTYVRDRMLYSRVDMIPIGGQLTLMELEILEPSLYFAQDGEAPKRFARALHEIWGSARAKE